MNTTGSTVKKSGGSTAVVISLAVAALIAWAGGGTALGALFTLVLRLGSDGREGARVRGRRRHAAGRRLLLRARGQPRLDRARNACCVRRARVRNRVRGRALAGAPLRAHVLRARGCWNRNCRRV